MQTETLQTIEKMENSIIGKLVEVSIDRPLGSFHSVYKDLYYPINYGFIKGIYAADGEYQDAYILGVDHPVSVFSGVVIAVVHRLNDVEDKWIVAPNGVSFTKEEITDLVLFQEKYFDFEIIT